MSWKIKLDDQEQPVFEDRDGVKCPVYIDPEGTELALDPPSMFDKIQNMGKQNQKDRDKYKEMRDTLKVFDGIKDLAEWKKQADEALSTMQNLKDKDLMDAEKVSQLKKEINTAWEEKIRLKESAISDIEKKHAIELAEKDTKIRTLLVSNKFAQSKYFNGKDSITVLPSDIAEDHFGKNFRVEEENGKMALRAYHDNGDLVRSKVNPGEPAEFDEAMGFILDKHPRRDALLRGSSGGSGSIGGDSDNGSGSNDIKKLEQQLAEAQKAGNVVATISIKNRLFDAKKREANG